MKKFVLWLIRVFKLDIPTVKYVKDDSEVKKIYVSEASKYDHDLVIDGNLLVNGSLTVSGEITCYKALEK